jgi:hypothetical protein
LESLGLLAVAPARGVSPLFPKVYYVTGRGVLRLKKSLAEKGKPWESPVVDRRGRHAKEGYGADRIMHEILTTEFLLAVWQTLYGRPDLKLLTMQRRSLARHESFKVDLGTRKARLIPDAMFLFRQSEGGMACCFVEMDNGTMNRKKIEAKYARYAAWSESAEGKQYLLDLYRKHGAQNPRPAFRLLVIARSRTGRDDEGRLGELMVWAAKMPSSLKSRLWFTTVQELCRWQRNSLPLNGAIWCQGCDRGHPKGRNDGHGQDRLQERFAGSSNNSPDCRRSLFPAAEAHRPS